MREKMGYTSVMATISIHIFLFVTYPHQPNISIFLLAENGHDSDIIRDLDMEDYGDRENPFHFLSDSQLLETRHAIIRIFYCQPATLQL